MIRLYFGRWGSIGRFSTVVKLPRLLRTLGDFGDKEVAEDIPGTCAVIDTGDTLKGEAINFCSDALSSTVEDSSWSKLSVWIQFNGILLARNLIFLKLLNKNILF